MKKNEEKKRKKIKHPSLDRDSDADSEKKTLVALSVCVSEYLSKKIFLNFFSIFTLILGV